MKLILSFFLTMVILPLVSTSNTWPAILKNKIDVVVKNTYQIEAYALEEIEIEAGEEEDTKAAMSDNLFEVSTGDISKGYIFVSQAPSMKNVFDYIVLFDSNFKVVNTKVLIYREQHGRQIGTKRWLSQFFGMTPDDSPELGVQVDGISGATISTKSMTLAMQNLLNSINYLESKDFLND